jgi:hypothetical protein
MAAMGNEKQKKSNPNSISGACWTLSLLTLLSSSSVLFSTMFIARVLPVVAMAVALPMQITINQRGFECLYQPLDVE